MSPLATWAPPIVWTALVFTLSSAQFSAEQTGSLLHSLLQRLAPWLTPEHLARLHGLTRKAAHLTEYAILAALWFRAFTRGGATRPAAARLALALSVGCAALDEAHQALVPDRTGSVTDVLLDTLGALAVLVPARLGWWRVTDATTSVLLWVAAGGGLVFLALGLAAGGDGGLLRLTVPLAIVLLIYRWRRRSAID